MVNWTAAYEAHAGDLLQYLRRFVHSQDRAEDLLHETFVRALGATDPPRADEVRPWLYRVASNLALSALRGDARRRLWMMDARPQLAPTSDLAELEHVRAALRSIPPDQAVALVLTLHQGFSRIEAAEIVQVPIETLKTRIARGRLNFAAAYARLERGLPR